MQLNVTQPASTSSQAGPESGLPHLTGTGAALRQVMAADALRDCRHILEIGGHQRPITPYLTHRPLSVTSVDPKTEAFEAETLNGAPCRVRHIAAKFQEVAYDYEPDTYGLVLLGYSLKAFGRNDPLGTLLFSLIDNARVVVIEYAPQLDRAATQVPAILSRPTVSVRTRIDLALHDPQIVGTAYADRRFYILDTHIPAS